MHILFLFLFYPLVSNSHHVGTQSDEMKKKEEKEIMTMISETKQTKTQLPICRHNTITEIINVPKPLSLPSICYKISTHIVTAATISKERRRKLLKNISLSINKSQI